MALRMESEVIGGPTAQVSATGTETLTPLPCAYRNMVAPLRRP